MGLLEAKKGKLSRKTSRAQRESRLSGGKKFSLARTAALRASLIQQGRGKTRKRGEKLKFFNRGQGTKEGGGFFKHQECGMGGR